MNTYNKYCWLLLSSLLIAFNTAIAAKASEIKTQKQIFSPLNIFNISQSSTVYLSKSNHNSSNNSSREYTFKAPNSKTLTNNGQLTAAEGYKVEVYGNAEELLLQVKNIEPGAFIKGNIIQVGIFSQQDNAEDLVRKLAVAGFWARIVAQ
ncbi:MAG: SPOR domain-containing protein [Pleurocapsa sp.]